MSSVNPEARARQKIDALLTAAGWTVQHRDQLNLGAGRGVAVREFPLKTGYADYLLFVDRRALGAVEAKPAGATLSGVEAQSEKYSVGLDAVPPAWHSPLPFLYESTGVETFFTNGLDPEPRSRPIFAFHRPETLAEWAREGVGDGRHPPSTLRLRLRQMPPLVQEHLWPPQIEAIQNLEQSFAADRPRALIQMATGSGKTFTAVNFVYRLIKYARARRVLFLVDRNNLGRQALREFQAFATPDDGRKFSELYNVQRLESNALDPVNRVVITTIQRLYSLLAGETEFNADNEEESLWELGGALDTQSPKEVRYNPAIPVEYFDFIITDECHRSIYNLWRQVLEYFDASIIGLTATPSRQTFGFFNQNLVMEYSRQRAVADGINVDGQVYRIRTEITAHGSQVEAGYYVDRRNKLTRKLRWEQLDEDLVYTPEQLDRDVVSESQIRTVLGAFRQRLFSELFPGRKEVPKTLVFAKDDSHAEDIVRILREEFGKGNEFCQKITYRTTGKKTEDLIAEFRNSYFPRIAVTVDMIATGTDIKPIECLLFMRLVRSRIYFEQMLGRGTRVIAPTDLQAVTPDARNKERFILVDTVGVVDSATVDTQTLERKRSVPFDKLLEMVALGAHDENTLSSLAGRLASLNRQMSYDDQAVVSALSGGIEVQQLALALLEAIDPDRIHAAAAAHSPGGQVDEAGLAQAAEELAAAALKPFDSAELRQALVKIQKQSEQIIDRVSVDTLQVAGFSQEDTEKAQATVASFRKFIEQNKDEIGALQIIFSQPYARRRLTYQQVKELAALLEQPPHSWTTEALWRAYAQLERDHVRGLNQRRVLTDIISLVRHAVELEDELLPYPERVAQRYKEWLAAQQASGRLFNARQRWWLDRIAEHIGINLALKAEDLNSGEFFNQGGQFAAMQIFGAELPGLLDELSGALG